MGPALNQGTDSELSCPGPACPSQDMSLAVCVVVVLFRTKCCADMLSIYTQVVS